MRKLFIVLFLVASVGLMWGQIISQYIETNSGTSPKGIEIWNNTGSQLDFSANNLVIEKGTNGGAPSVDYTLSNGTLADGEVIVIGTSDMETTTVNNGSAFYEKAFTFNGDDALVVKYGGTTTDVFGDPGTGDPGSGWDGNGVQTYNQNIQLLGGITTGDTDGWTDPSTRFETVSTDPVNDQTGFGIAPVAGGNQPPTITNITQTPETGITSSTTVSVSADVVDPDAARALNTVELHWGTTSGSLTNTINMSNTSGDTYTTDSDIPAQTDGTTVYYEIYASDDNDPAGETTSAEQSYVVNDPATTTLPYEETFASDLGDCYTYSVSGATKEWYWDSDGFAAINGYDSGDTEEDWLILPGINLDNYSDEVMTFDSWYQYGSDDVNNYLKVFYSTDYSGIGDPSPARATWTELGYNQPGSAETWVGSGDIDLSAITGTNIHIAFKYNYESGNYRKWQIDNLEILEASANTPPEITSIIHTPENPNTSQTVSVEADVTDDNSVGAVSLYWDTASGDVVNTGTEITMSASRATYTTDSAIPAQTEGTTIYYVIYALDNELAATTSAEQSYYVTDAVAPQAGDLYISEVDTEYSRGCFVEIINISDNTVLLDNVSLLHYNGRSSANATVNLSGYLASGDYIVVARNQTNFENTYGFAADYYESNMYLNDGDEWLELDISSRAVVDNFGSDGVSWTQGDTFERTNITGDGSSMDDWTDMGDTVGSPGADNENTLPVTLSEFNYAMLDNEAVEIRWITETETDIRGFNILRNIENEQPESAYNYSIISPEGNCAVGAEYSFQDEEINLGETYYYWLEVVNLDMSSDVYGPLEVLYEEDEDNNNDDSLVSTNLLGAFPNPVLKNDNVEIKYKLSKDKKSNASISIYNLKGQVVKTFNSLEAGEGSDGAGNSVIWDGKDNNGNECTSGIYFYKMEATNFLKTNKVILIK